MSILINGMEMPKSCAFCRFYGAYCYAKGDEDAHSTAPCPLVELPPHGRLIDADDLLAMVKRAMEDDDMYEDDYRDVRDWLAVAPTIIEAEGET